MGRKGFVFTTDAFVALTLIALVIVVIIYQLNIPSALFPQQMQTHDFATDIMIAFTGLRMDEISTVVPVLPEDRGNSVLAQIAKEALAGNDVEAEQIAKDVLASGSKPLLPVQFGASIFVRNPVANAWEEVKVREAPYTRVQSAASYVLLGYSPGAARNPGETPYDYPPEETDAEKEPYCNNYDSDEVVLPCPAHPASVFDAGELMDPAYVRVVVWV